MTNNYKYKDINLNNLISDINSSVATTNFINISQGVGTNVTDLKTMENSATLYYTESGIDISTKTRAINSIYSTAQTNTVVDLLIPGTSTKFTHFTVYLAGGSGGGAGAGGDAETNGGSNVSANTSFGGRGGDAGYVALTNNISLGNNTLYVTVGSRGALGREGADDNNPGQNGSPGTPGSSGGSSYVDLGVTRICTANGGGGGFGGGGANSGGGNGNTGANGTPGSGTIVSGYTGNTSYNTANNPSITLTGGLGGDNNSSIVPQGTGGDGNPGYVRVYLKYIPP